MTVRDVDAGFTLIEVMIALFIFAISATALSVVFQTNVNNARALKEKTMATWVAENRLAEMHASHAFPEMDTREDRVQMAGNEWWVQTVVSQTLPGFRKVLIRVAPLSGAPQPVATVSGYVTNVK